MSRKHIALERHYTASTEQVWALWTTADGIASWWGPEGFTVVVRSLDLKPQGELHYAMTATAPEQAAFMKRAGMPLTTEVVVTYTEVLPRQRLAFFQQVDFVPNVPSYPITTVVELFPTESGVRTVVTVEAMHNETWTQRAIAGQESQLRKLDILLRGSPS